MGVQISTTTIESSMEVPQKIKNGDASLPSNFTSGNLSEETQNSNPNEYMHSHIHFSIIYNSQAMEATQCPSTDDRIKKQWYTYEVCQKVSSHVI